jgi:hypothetical protein
VPGTAVAAADDAAVFVLGQWLISWPGPKLTAVQVLPAVHETPDSLTGSAYEGDRQLAW